jgi:CheY-like chemotaxis protein
MILVDPSVIGKGVVPTGRLRSNFVAARLDETDNRPLRAGKSQEHRLMRVFLVEDDAAAAAGIKKMLPTENFICDTTDLGEDGPEIGRLHDYDIILLDLKLPDIDGYEVLRRLRAGRVRIPVLILTELAELDHKIWVLASARTIS